MSDPAPFVFHPALARAPQRAQDPHANEKHLQPGAFLAPAEAETIIAVVSSGVVVCLWDPLRHAGGACYFVMPNPISDMRTDGRFGAFAVPHLLQLMRQGGSQPAQLRACLFGGGASPFSSFRGTAMDMGRQNLALARRLLEDQRVLNLSEFTGGAHALKVRFHSGDGNTHYVRLHETGEDLA